MPNTLQDIEDVIQEAKELLEKTTDEKEKRELEEMLDYFIKMKEKPKKREGLWSS